MTYTFNLKICECGHSIWVHNSKGCKDLVPNNEGKTHNETDDFRVCRCKKFDLAIDCSLEEIHIKPFGSK